MSTNVGSMDRILRGALGVILLTIAFASGSGLWWLAGILGAIMIGTALTSSCPIYSALGTSTCQVKRS
jgi:Protein of unknown function (DUF2892)